MKAFLYSHCDYCDGDACVVFEEDADTADTIAQETLGKWFWSCERVEIDTAAQNVVVAASYYAPDLAARTVTPNPRAARDARRRYLQQALIGAGYSVANHTRDRAKYQQRAERGQRVERNTRKANEATAAIQRLEQRMAAYRAELESLPA